MTYFRVYLLLLALAAATTAVAFLDLGRLNGPAALLIAAAKTGLVVLYFMHVRTGSPTTKLFVGTAFFWVAILAVLTFGDVLTRGQRIPSGPPEPARKTAGPP